jgi:N-acetylmuramic acid 6-phosphate etherase
MPRARAAARPKAVDYAALPTELRNPQAELLDTLPPDEVVRLLVDEEAGAVRAVKARTVLVAQAARLVADRLLLGGRMVYVGAGTSGRLGTLDGAECIPTFGLLQSRVVTIIAGGPHALTHAVEGAEDNARDGEARLRRASVGPNDAVIAIAASGVTPFVRAALEYAQFRRAATIFVTCTDPAPTGGAPIADIVIPLATGPEVIAGSTRLKAGTATKITLNAISTTAMVLLGKVYGGLMVDVRPTNTKLWARAVRILRQLSDLDEPAAYKLLKKAGGRAKLALVMHHARVSAGRAQELLNQHRGSLRAIVGDLPVKG